MAINRITRHIIKKKIREKVILLEEIEISNNILDKELVPALQCLYLWYSFQHSINIRNLIAF